MEYLFGVLANQNPSSIYLFEYKQMSFLEFLPGSCSSYIILIHLGESHATAVVLTFHSRRRTYIQNTKFH